MLRWTAFGYFVLVWGTVAVLLAIGLVQELSQNISDGSYFGR